jgi:hypothetical protein
MLEVLSGGGIRGPGPMGRGKWLFYGLHKDLGLRSNLYDYIYEDDYNIEGD